MRVVIDALSMLPVGASGGGETYIEGMVRHLGEGDGQNQYLVVATRDTSALFVKAGTNVHVHLAPIDNTIRTTRIAYEQLWLPRVASRWGADLVWFPGNMMSGMLGAFRIPGIVTIHDTAPWFYEKCFPEAFSRVRVGLLKSLVRQAAREAARVLTVSDFSKREIVEHTGISPDKIAVLYPTLAPAGPAGASVPIQVPRPFVLLVGRSNKHKNFATFIDGFARAHRAHALPHHVVIAGSAGSGHAGLLAAIERHRLSHRVHFLGQVPQPKLAQLYASADFFAMPSLYEGFGFPALEAMQYGTPALLSHCGSLPEIAGDGALYFDPAHEQQLAEKIAELCSSEPLRVELSRKARARFAQLASVKIGPQLIAQFDLAVSKVAATVVVPGAERNIQ